MKGIIIGLCSVIVLSCARAEVIAEVNGKKISLDHLKQEMKKLPESVRKNFENDYQGFLDELITKEILLQEAGRQKIDTISAVKQDKEKRDGIVIEELLRHEVLPGVQVGEDEIMQFYKDNESQMQGSTYEQIKSQIYDFLLQQKQQDAIESYISMLLSNAKISRNKKWLKREEAKLKNPITEALKNNLPTMVDFGAGTCIPCIKMKPIIEELQKKCEDKANILFIDVNEEPVLTRKYKIMLIPTQIFYDTTGNEIYRHIGFFPKDSIMVFLNNGGMR